MLASGKRMAGALEVIPTVIGFGEYETGLCSPPPMQAMACPRSPTRSPLTPYGNDNIFSMTVTGKVYESGYFTGFPGTVTSTSVAPTLTPVTGIPAAPPRRNGQLRRRGTNGRIEASQPHRQRLLKIVLLPQILSSGNHIGSETMNYGKIPPLSSLISKINPMVGLHGLHRRQRIQPPWALPPDSVRSAMCGTNV